MGASGSTSLSESAKPLANVPELASSQLYSFASVVNDDPLMARSEVTIDSTPEETKEVGCFRTTISTLNAIFGASILAIPQAIAFIGILPSIALIVFMAFLNHWTSVMILKLAERYQVQSFNAIGAKILGRAGSWAITVTSLLLFNVILLGYIVIAVGTVISWFELAHVNVSDAPGKFPWKRFLMVGGYMVLPIALTLPRQSLVGTFAGIMNIALCSFFCVALFIKMIIMVAAKDPPMPKLCWGRMTYGLFSAISVHAGAFGLPVVVLSKLRDYTPNMKERSFISGLTMFICWIANIFAGIVGYVMYGDHCEAVILDSFNYHDPLMEIVRSSFFFVKTCAYPGIGQTMMDMWADILFGKGADDTGPRQKAVLVLFTNIIPLFTAIFLPKAGPALAVAGAFGGCILDFFFPALMWLIDPKIKRGVWENLGCVLIVVFGFACAIITTYQQVVVAIGQQDQG
jgi:amino acid permease